MAFPAYPGLGSRKDANARIIITIKSSPRGATRESIKIVPSRGEGCVYERVFDSLGRQIQMTSEMHVTISAAQQGGMHPLSPTLRPPFSHERTSRSREKIKRKTAGRRKKKKLLFTAQSTAKSTRLLSYGKKGSLTNFIRGDICSII